MQVRATKLKIKFNLFKDEIVTSYCSGALCKDLADKYECSEFSLRNFLKKVGVFESSRILRAFDTNFFDKIDTEEKAWALGLWYTDGSVLPTGIRIRMTDLDILQKLKAIIKYDGPITEIKKKHGKYKQYYGIYIPSKELSNQLISLGCIIDKTFNLQFPTENIVPKHLQKHFVRGLFDGDGWAGKRNVGICGASPMIKDLQAAMKNHIDIYMRRDDRVNKSSGRVTYFQNIERSASIDIFLRWIYGEATIYGDRKRANGQILLDNRERINNKKLR